MLWKTVPDCGCGMAEGSFSEGRLNSVDLQQTSAIRSQLACRGVRLNQFVQVALFLSGQHLECYSSKFILDAVLNR